MMRIAFAAVICLFVFVFPSFEANASSDGEIDQDSTKYDMDFKLAFRNLFCSEGAVLGKL